MSRPRRFTMLGDAFSVCEPNGWSSRCGKATLAVRAELVRLLESQGRVDDDEEGRCAADG